ncbi:aldo-keto reductase 1B-like [Clavelina lepadiformis]|uniref:aldo-keto reductase 1B-like n=1 Tax=Clavelina lepadiformis TaxID=159417 RepID=UPI0040429A3E
MANVDIVTMNDGKKIPMAGLGTWKSPKGEVQKAVEFAIDCGYRHIDCAYCYGNQDEVGNGIQTKIKENVVKREDLFITDKLWNVFHSPKDVRPTVVQTLKNLQLDYLDLYLIHWPQAYINNGETFPKDKDGKFIYDDTDYVDTWKAFEEVRKEGLVRSIGLSNFNIYQINRVLNECSVPPAMLQIEINPYLKQKEIVDFCQEKGITVTAYSPLGSPDRPWAKDGEPILLEDPKLVAIAGRLNKTVAQVVMKYLLQRGIIVIPKSVTPSRIKSNLRLFDFTLSKEDMDVVDGFDRNFRGCALEWVSDHKHYPFKENYSE